MKRNCLSGNSILSAKMPKKSLTPDENESLVRQVLAGDMAARDKLIVGNTPLVIIKVNTFIREHPSAANLRDDMTSAGFMGLTEAVNCLTSDITNPLGYIASRIYHRIDDLLEEEMLVRIPTESKRQAKKHNRPLAVYEVKILSDDHYLEGETDYEMRDLIESCCETSEELEFIGLRELGHTLSEIAEKFGKPLVTVFRMFDGIRNRVSEKIKNLT